MKLFLDDLRLPNMSHNSSKGLGSSLSDEKDWTIVRDYYEFIEIIDKSFDSVELISFDHDLACFDKNGQELTGHDCVRYLISYCIDNDKEFPNWYIHSDNSVGRQNMISTILNFLNRIENKDVSKFRYYNKGIINNNFV